MKKLLTLIAVLTLFIVTASAQDHRNHVRRDRIERGFDRAQLSRSEKFRLQQNRLEFNAQKRRALRDGKISPSERRRLINKKRHDRREEFRFKHNSRRRLL